MREWNANIGDLPMQFAAFHWRLENNAWIDGSFRKIFETMPLAEKYLAGKKLRLKEKQTLLDVFDRHGEINCPFGTAWNPKYSESQFELFGDEITEIVMYWINALTMTHNAELTGRGPES